MIIQIIAQVTSHVDPDRSADTGTQYFTFIQRQVVANFGIDITATGIEGLWIAATGTAIDSASGLNGWIDCTVQYAGVGNLAVIQQMEAMVVMVVHLRVQTLFLQEQV